VIKIVYVSHYMAIRDIILIVYLYRAIKEAWIKAKYVEKKFVSKLRSSTDSEIKGWRVKKKTRRSPGPSSSPQKSGEKSGEKSLPDSPDSDVTSGLLEGIYTMLGDTKITTCTVVV